MATCSHFPAGYDGPPVLQSVNSRIADMADEIFHMAGNLHIWPGKRTVMALVVAKEVAALQRSRRLRSEKEGPMDDELRRNILTGLSPVV